MTRREVSPVRSTGVDARPRHATSIATPPVVKEVLDGPGQALDALTRRWSEPRFGHDFGKVRVHADARAAESALSVGAEAYTVGEHVVFGADRYRPQDAAGRRLLAHELAHVAQEAEGRGHGDVASLEAEANRLSGTSHRPLPVHGRMRLGGHALHRRPSPSPSPELSFAMLLSIGPLTADQAKQAFAIYRTIPAAKRPATLETHFKSGALATLLRALPQAEAINVYPNELREMLRFVQEASTRAASGKSDDKMAEVQAKFQRAEAEKAAAAAAAAKAPVGKAAPKASEAEIESARKEKVAKTSVAPPAAVIKWDGMDKATRDDWIKRAGVAVDAVVRLAATRFPELKLKKTHFDADFARVEKRGANVLAFEGGSAAAPTAVVGYEFVRAAEADPAYVLGIVTHELFGHREYGAYGSEYHLKLYDQAQAKIPGYVKPAAGSDQRRTETDSYAYQETEIYALLRSLPQSTTIAPKDAGKKLVGYDPATFAKARIGIIKSQWEPTIAVAVVRGLYQRLLLDPRITGPAINVFRDGVKAHFSAAEAKEILK